MRPYGTPSKKTVERDAFDKKGRMTCYVEQVPVKAKERRRGRLAAAEGKGEGTGT